MAERGRSAARRILVLAIVLFGVLAIGYAARKEPGGAGTETLEARKYARKLKKVVLWSCEGLSASSQEALWKTLRDTRGIKEALVRDRVVVYYFPELIDVATIRSTVQQHGCPVSGVEEASGEQLYIPNLYVLRTRIFGLEDCEECRERAEKALKELPGTLNVKLAEDGQVAILIDGQIMGPQTVRRIMQRERLEVGNIETEKVERGF